MKNGNKEIHKDANVIALSSRASRKRDPSKEPLAWATEIDLKTPWVIRLLAVVAILLLSMLIL